MKGRIQGHRSRWLRVAFVVAAAITAHALNGGSAQAAMIDATPPAHTIVLAGFTSQHYPLFFRISSDGKMLLGGGIAISMSCTSGADIVVPDAFARVPIHAKGRLHAGFSSPTIITNGTTTQETDALSATLSPKHSQLTGTWQLAVNYGFADGTSDQCASGPVRFKFTSS
ncbi:MAG TPA: hypothetical protein VJ741_09360 [Solirubrobacteraceae bacterium]|nr:hypothetical protein [Solirubrobacteraceae bacterium]